MRNGWIAVVITACVTATALTGGANPAAAAPAEQPSLSTVINDAIHAAGPLVTPRERALIMAKCGYRANEWSGRNINISNGVLHCTNGRKVDDAETRAMIAVMGPRISRQVSAIMASEPVQAAIRDHAAEATRRALANLGRR